MATEHTAKSFRRLPFNMIEVVLALAVVAIGMLSILGLIPIGTKATRDAIGSSYAADRADFLLHYIAAKATTSSSSWNTYITNANPRIPQDKTDVQSPAGDASDTSIWSQPAASEIEDLYYTDSYPDTTTERKAYRFISKRVRRGEPVVEFDGVVTVWTSRTSSSKYLSGSGWQAPIDAPRSERALINAEVSWPSTLEYADRQKMSFSLEVAAP